VARDGPLMLCQSMPSLHCRSTSSSIADLQSEFQLQRKLTVGFRLVTDIAFAVQPSPEPKLTLTARTTAMLRYFRCSLHLHPARSGRSRAIAFRRANSIASTLNGPAIGLIRENARRALLSHSRARAPRCRDLPLIGMTVLRLEPTPAG
jgi:hypothetical protein